MQALLHLGGQPRGVVLELLKQGHQPVAEGFTEILGAPDIEIRRWREPARHHLPQRLRVRVLLLTPGFHELLEALHGESRAVAGDLERVGHRPGRWDSRPLYRVLRRVGLLFARPHLGDLAQQLVGPADPLFQGGKLRVHHPALATVEELEKQLLQVGVHVDAILQHLLPVPGLEALLEGALPGGRRVRHLVQHRHSHFRGKIGDLMLNPRLNGSMVQLSKIPGAVHVPLRPLHHDQEVGLHRLLLIVEVLQGLLPPAFLHLGEGVHGGHALGDVQSIQNLGSPQGDVVLRQQCLLHIHKDRGIRAPHPLQHHRLGQLAVHTHDVITDPCDEGLHGLPHLGDDVATYERLGDLLDYHALLQEGLPLVRQLLPPALIEELLLPLLIGELQHRGLGQRRGPVLLEQREILVHRHPRDHGVAQLRHLENDGLPGVGHLPQPALERLLVDLPLLGEQLLRLGLRHTQLVLGLLQVGVHDLLEVVPQRKILLLIRRLLQAQLPGVQVVFEGVVDGGGELAPDLLLHGFGVLGI
mmetsp:Transcript_70034/g.186660  ORF Transcript_70034/g.186660 Transcript_70034/m.186660 type:complete len:528 (-) Transcript_70034:266-1849(-)